MTPTPTMPACQPAVMNDPRARTESALHSILTKLGGCDFAEAYLEDFVEYVYSGELPTALRELRDREDETYLKVIRVISEAQSEAIAEAVPEPPSRMRWFWSLFSRTPTREEERSSSTEHEEVEVMAH